MSKVIFHGESTVRALCEAGSVTAITIREGNYGEFHLLFKTPDAEVRLQKKRNENGAPAERTFKDLTRAAQLVKSMGLVKFACEMNPTAHAKQNLL